MAEETKEKLRRANLGKKMSEDTKRKISESVKKAKQKRKEEINGQKK